jgi:hypothetical protein
MKNLLAFIASSFVCAFVSSAQSYLPAPSTDDGILVRRLDTSPNQAHWPDSSLHDYRTSSDNAFSVPTTGESDRYGRRWTATAPSRAQLGSSAGTIRVIFLGPGDDCFIGGTGYTYSGSATRDAFTYATAAGIPHPSALDFGDFADLPLGYGEGNSVDLWTVSANAWYTLFDSTKSQPSPAPGRVSWLEDPLLVPTYIDATGQYSLVPTWIVSVDEPPTASTPGGTHRLAVQFFYSTGQAFEPYYGDATRAKTAGQPRTEGVAGCPAGALVACRD